MRRSAHFNGDRSRRYWLERDWSEESLPRGIRTVAMFGLNPSKADEKDDDMTIRKGIGFCERWGYNGLMMLNLNPIVATDPLDLPMWGTMGGLDMENVRHQKAAIQTADLIVVAWGKPDKYVARNIAFGGLVFSLRQLIQASGRETYCIGTTKDLCYPLHPSRTAYTQSPVLFDWNGGR